MFALYTGFLTCLVFVSDFSLLEKLCAGSLFLAKC